MRYKQIKIDLMLNTFDAIINGWCLNYEETASANVMRQWLRVTKYCDNLVS